MPADLSSVAKVLSEHRQVSPNPLQNPGGAECSCGWSVEHEELLHSAPDDGFRLHVAEMLAAAGLVAETHEATCPECGPHEALLDALAKVIGDVMVDQQPTGPIGHCDVITLDEAIPGIALEVAGEVANWIEHADHDSGASGVQLGVRYPDGHVEQGTEDFVTRWTGTEHDNAIGRIAVSRRVTPWRAADEGGEPS